VPLGYLDKGLIETEAFKNDLKQGTIPVLEPTRIEFVENRSPRFLDCHVLPRTPSARETDVVKNAVDPRLGVKRVAKRCEEFPALGAGQSQLARRAVRLRVRRAREPPQPGQARDTQPRPPLRRVRHTISPVGVGGVTLEGAQRHRRDGR
jgi:hypothetical protein